MQKRKFDELISHFNRKVSDMSIDQKYKMELLGMISAIGFAHEKELSTNLAEVGTDCISRQQAIDALNSVDEYNARSVKAIKELPPVQPKKEIAKRVLWTGWKGCRNTRYKCPNCKKPVKNDDIYCHRCGQKLMFPHISFTDYVHGEKQETIVRWDDE
jgi:hypothetical protein